MLKNKGRAVVSRPGLLTSNPVWWAMAAKELPPAELLRQLFRYDPETGFLIRASTNRRAGCKEAKGYIAVDVGKMNRFKAHRIIWAIVYGVDPKDQIDHINQVKDDNRISNLRLATNSENQVNSGIFKNNKSGAKGVRWDQTRNKWVVQITKNKRKKTIGRYDRFEEAVAARSNAEIMLFGEYAKVDNNEQ